MEHKQRQVNDWDLARKAKLFQILISLVAMLAAPFIFFAESGFYTYIQQLSGMFCIPIFTVILLGFCTKTVTPFAAKSGMVLFIVAYVFTNYIIEVKLHYLHLFGILFLVTTTWILMLTKLSAAQIKEIVVVDHTKSLQPWKHLNLSGAILIILMIAVFILFSPLGIA